MSTKLIPDRFLLVNRFPVWLTFFLIVIYHPILGTYAHTDAYEFFWNARRNPIFHHVFIQGGRPLFGWSVTKLFQLIPSIEDLKYIRLIAFLGNTLLLISFYRFLIDRNFARSFSTALTLFFACSSFICLAMSWTAVFQIGWAMLLGLISTALIIKSIETKSPKSLKRTYFASGILSGIGCLMLYQPTYTIFVFLSFLVFEKDRKADKLLSLLGIYLSIFLLYFILFKLMLWLTDLPPLDRAGLSLNVFEKLRWFMDTAFVNSLGLNLHLINNAKLNIFRVPLVLFFSYCSIIYFTKKGFTKETITYALLVLLVYLLAYLPNLVAVENHASNRTLVTITLLNAYFLFKGLELVILSGRVLQTAYILLTLLFAGFAYTTLRWGVTKIHSTEYAILKNAISEILTKDSTHQITSITVIRPTRQFLQEQKIVLKESGGEIGLLSNSVEWATEPMFRHLIDAVSIKTNHNPSTIFLQICASQDADECLLTGENVIDIGNEFLTHYMEYY